MKANVLTIGDWYYRAVTHSNIDGDYTIEYVPKKLTLDDLIFAKENDWDDNDWNEFTKPIQLTKEILEKNSINVNEHCDLSKPLYTIGINAGRFHITGQFKYVHELQHALRLCGLDKLANDFQI